MKKLLLLTLILAVAATGAIAKEKVEYTCSTLVVKNEAPGRQGGEDIGTAVAIAGLPFTGVGTTAGFADDYDVACSWTATAPEVVYSFSPAVDTTIDADLCSSAYDTKLYIADSALNVLACNDDSCPGYMSELFDVFLPGGDTYYIFVDGYGSSSGAYELNITEDITIPAPDNDVCAGAINLDGQYQFVVDTCDGYTNQYSPGSGGCTGYSANGADAVYFAVLPEGGRIDVSIAADFDASLYLITDCGDPVGSCVAGDDQYPGGAEAISYTGGPGTYYLIVDGYSGCGPVTVTMDNLVPTEDTNLSTIKSMY